MATSAPRAAPRKWPRPRAAATIDAPASTRPALSTSAPMSSAPAPMKVLVIGSGGREHALCWKIARSPLVDEVVCAPGNAGIRDVARIANVAETVGSLERAQQFTGRHTTVHPKYRPVSVQLHRTGQQVVAVDVGQVEPPGSGITENDK